MSQSAVEETLGRLVCDDLFRHEFYEDPDMALRRVGLQLTRVELAGLRHIRRGTLESLARRLDERIRRASGEAEERTGRHRT